MEGIDCNRAKWDDENPTRIYPIITFLWLMNWNVVFFSFFLLTHAVNERPDIHTISTMHQIDVCIPWWASSISVFLFASFFFNDMSIWGLRLRLWESVICLSIQAFLLCPSKCICDLFTYIEKKMVFGRFRLAHNFAFYCGVRACMQARVISAGYRNIWAFLFFVRCQTANFGVGRSRNMWSRKMHRRQRAKS